MKNIKLTIIMLAAIFLISACLAGPRETGSQTEDGDPNGWQTYTNDKYRLAVRFPSVWQVIELPTPEYPEVADQIWFVSEVLPPPQTGSRADIVFTFGSNYS